MIPYVTGEIHRAAGSIGAGWRFVDAVQALPERFRAPVKSRFFQASEQGGPVAAMRYVSQVEADLSQAPLSLDATDGEICDYARQRAGEVRSLLMAITGSGAADDLRATLQGYCAQFGAMVPPGVLLAGLIGRMTEPAWWRRQVRRNHARQVEAHAIALGFVHRCAGLYASDEAVRRHGEQQQRNAANLQQTEATNEEGLTMTLAELAAVSVSNPRIRRGELMTRIAGFEGFAKSAGHVGMFYTATAPSRMHPRLSKSGKENPKFDGTTPKDCAGYLSKTWAKARAWLHRRGIAIYGFRVAEPHHDGTPHWHMLFFMLPAVVESVTACLRRYFCEVDAAELAAPAAAKARFEAVKIDWKRGSAAGYISKYIAKNIDGSRNDLSSIGQAHDETEEGVFEVGEADKIAPRVLAWASTWGIRQFQQIGGPGVTVWRELRRLRDMKQGDLFDTWSAADVGNWQQFTELQGGATCRRDARPVQLWRDVLPGKLNRYGEEAAPAICGVSLHQVNYETRLHTWEIRRGAKAAPDMGKAAEGAAEFIEGAAWVRRGRGFRLSGAKRPWSPVNNCTGIRKDADGYTVGEFSQQETPRALTDSERARIKAAEVAAILGSIEAKRRRGAFGQFPKLPVFHHSEGGKHVQ